MPKYLVAVRYTAEGARGLAREGGTNRRRAAEQQIASVGGTLECFYYAMGDTDLYVIADMPDENSALAVSLSVAESGGATMTTTPLFTAEQMDAAANTTVTYRPPGSELSPDQGSAG